MIRLSEFVGNRDLIDLLRISVQAAKQRNQPLPHLLLKGPAGTGKTTLAEAIAQEFGTEPLALTPSTAKKTEDLRKLFLQMPGDGYDSLGLITGKIKPQIIFVDEVHQLPLVAQENLGLAMQDWKIPVKVNGKDAWEWVPRFTLIGATTLPGKLSKPFLDRFKIQSDFETYTLVEATQIAEVHAKRLGIGLEAGVAEAVARRSRGVARLIVRFLERLGDGAVITNPDKEPFITLEMAKIIFRRLLKVDDRGLTKSDVKVLIQLAQANEPLGIDALATMSNEDKNNIQNAIEPYLVQEGLILRTKRGRVITDAGRRHLADSGYLKEAVLSGRRIVRD